MTLTRSQIVAACQQAQQEITVREAADFLAAHHDLNWNTARDLVSGYRSMLSGTGYKRGLSQDVVTHYLENAVACYGLAALSNALSSLMISIEYEEGVKRVNRRGLRRIHSQFSQQLG